jgi:NAD(P)-dependent dehydrogenase (short-subunit alcohol dehydrogenase family)
MSSFADHVVLITGAASGIGRQLARNLAAEGARVAALDVQEGSLSRLTAELPGKAHAFEAADVTDRAALEGAVGRIRARLGPVDLLIACAGIGIETSALAYRAEDIERELQVNLVGVANSIGAVLPGMLVRGRGQLAALSSLASFRGLPQMAGYCASKAGLNALLESLRVELRPQGIAVTTVCPGWVRTPMTEQVDAPMPDLMEVEDAARHILWAIRRRRAFYAFPRSSALRVRLLRWLPAGVSDWLLGRMLRRINRRAGQPG